MKTRSLGRLINQNLRRNRKNLLFSSVGIVVGISSFVFFISLGNGVNRVVTTQIFPVDTNRIQVVPRLGQIGSTQGGRILDDQALGELEKISGVKSVYPRMKLSFLATMSVSGADIPKSTLYMLSKIPGVTPRMISSFKNIRMWLEIMGNGIDPRLVRDVVDEKDFMDPEPGQPIPVLLSKRMIEIYNSSFAQARGLPKINEALVPFLPPLPLTLNHSFISKDYRGQIEKTRIKIVGLSQHAIMGGITVPLQTARKLNLKYAGKRSAETYEAAILEVASSDFLGPVQQTINQLGFDVDLSEKRMAESVGLAVILVTLGFSLISLTIVAIAAVNIAHTFFMIVYERKREIGLLRALGATRADIRSMVLGEASLVGLVGGVVGASLGFFISGLVDLLANRVLPDFPFKPDSYFSYPWWLFVGSVLFAIIFCVLGAMFPAKKAARLDPASTLCGR